MSKLMNLSSFRNKPHRDGFDLSRKNCFTAKVGELLPVLCEEVLPGDKFTISPEWFTRTMPVNTAAYTRLREYFDFFFVPTRLLWRYFPNFVTQMDNEQSAFSPSTDPSTVGKVQPFVTLQEFFLLQGLASSAGTDICGQDSSAQTLKLLSYLNYPTSDIANNVNVPINVFPILAYQKIYYDYYRFEQWEKADPRIWNVDYFSGVSSSTTLYNNFSDLIENEPLNNPFTLRYCNWKKDLFMGILPRAQYGDEASLSFPVSNISTTTSTPSGRVSTLPIVANVNIERIGDAGTSPENAYVRYPYNSFLRTESGDDYYNGMWKIYGINNEYAASHNHTHTISTTLPSSSFRVMALRQAQALQKWKEISLSGNQDYRTQIEKHFGVKPSAILSGMCEFVGGTASSLDIGEVVNTNLTAEGSDPNIMGKGVGSGSGRIKFEAKEHGYFLCIYHAIPLLDYSITGIRPLLMKSDPTDYAIPEFDSLGMEPLRTLTLTRNVSQSGSLKPVDANSILGYVPRYIEYKTAIDEIHGEFNHSLGAWVAPLTTEWFYSHLASNSDVQTPSGSSSNQYTIKDYTFFKVTPSVLDSIFTVAAAQDGGGMATDNLLINAHFDFKAVRNLSYSGMPY